MTTRVVHCKRDDYDIYIGRPSKWGNPWQVGRDGTREQVIEKYRNMLECNPRLVEEAREELKGKVLGCWCFPQPCHGDTLIEFIGADMKPEQELDLRMADLGRRGVIRLAVAYPGNPKTYTYAAIEVDGLWYLTGADGGTGRSWDSLVDWLKSKNAEVTSLRHASEWEDLL